MRKFTKANSYIQGYMEGIEKGVLVAFDFLDKYIEHREDEVGMLSNTESDAPKVGELRGYSIIRRRIAEELTEIAYKHIVGEEECQTKN